MDPAFSANRFQMSQKILAVKSKYHIYNEAGSAVLYIEQEGIVQFKPSLIVQIDMGTA